jgi:hypothetical protein
VEDRMGNAAYMDSRPGFFGEPLDVATLHTTNPLTLKNRDVPGDLRLDG